MMFSLLGSLLFGQTTYTIIDGSSAYYYHGIPNYYYYGYTQNIYLQTQINQAGLITQIQLECNKNLDAMNPIKIYMAETTKSSFSSTSDWVNSDLTLVYSGSVDHNGSGFNTITLDNSFYYTNTNNLLITFDNDDGTSNGGSSYSYGYTTESGHTNQVLRQHSDYNDNDYGSTSYSGTRDDNLPSIKLTMTSDPDIQVTGSLSAFQGCSGGNSAEQTFTVAGSNLTADITLTAPSGFEISTTSGASFADSKTLTQSGGSVATTTIYVRTKTTATGSDGGNISAASTGATTKNVATGNPTVGLSTIYVNDNSTTGDIYASAAFDGSGDGTISDPVNTIADALALATCGVATTIYVDAGTYTEENITIADNTDDISIIGAGVSLTIFDGDNTDDWMEFSTGGNTSGITVTDMTVKEYGGTAQQAGGAVRVLGGSSIIFQDIVFESCSAYYSTTGQGGAAYLANAASVEFDRCIMRNNWADWRASTIYHASSGTLTLKNCLIYENTADGGGDIWIADNTGTTNVYNCTIVDNPSSSDYGSISCWTGTCNVYNTLFDNNGANYDPWDNSGTITSNYCMYDAADGTVNNTVSGSPTFVSSSDDDYRLKYGSTGINAGNNGDVQGSYDVDGNTRTQNTTVDVGAYEWNCDAVSAGTSGTSSTVCNNTTTTLTSYGYEAQYYKWQSSSDNSTWSDIASSDASSYTTPALTTTTYYRNAASCDNTTWSYGSSITKTVNHFIIYVNDNSTSGDVFCSAVGNDANNGTSALTPKLTLSAALSVAACGDTIKVDAGTYTADNNTISDGTTELFIKGAGSSLTIFDGDNTDEWMTFSSGGNTQNIEIEKMTIKQYGGTAQQDGGALRILGGTGIVFRDIIFETCSAYYSTNNGGVLYLENAAECEFDRCIMRHNWSDYRGSVIYHASTGTLTMKNCLVYENDADSGSEIWQNDGGGGMEITNCTFVDNTGTNSYGSISCWTGTCNVYNTIFDNNATSYDPWDNSGTITCNYCNYDAADGVTNNTVAGSPTFTSSGSDDYTLTSSSVGVDAGNNSYVSGITYDLSGGTRIQDGTVDLGAYEYAVNTWTGTTSTAWNVSTNWSLGQVPTSASGVVIADVSGASGNNPTIGDYTASVGTMTINAGAVLTISSTNSSYYLTVSGGITNNGTITHSGTVPIRLSGSSKSLAGTGTQTTAKYDIQSGGSYTLGASWSVDDMKVSSGGSLTVSDTYTFTVADEYDNDGTTTLTAGANLDVNDNFDNSGTITLNTGTLSIADNFTNTGTFTINTSTVTFDGSENSVITDTDGISFYNLTLNKTATADVVSTAGATSDITVTNNLTITEGTLSNGAADLSVTGTTTIDDGKLIAMASNGAMTLTGNLTLNNDAILDMQSTSGNLVLNGDIDINGTAGIQSSTTSTQAITFNKDGGNIYCEAAAAENSFATELDWWFNEDYTINDDISIGDLQTNGSAAASVTVVTGKTLKCSKLYNRSNATITLNGTANLIAAGNCWMAHHSGATFTMNSGTLDVDGALRMTGTSVGTFNANSGTIKVGGDYYSGTGTINYGTSTVEFDGSSAQVVQQTGITVSYAGSATVDALDEGFESGLGNFTSSGSVAWTTTTGYYHSGSKAAWNDYTSSDANYLTSGTIDLSSHTDANLTFSHIAKTEGGYDKCYVQYSENNGTTWTTFPTSKYTGSAASSSYFDEDDYTGTWGTSSTTPINTWWKDETYDMDFLCGQSDIKIRFYISSDGSIERYGWLIDDVKVSGTAGTGTAGAVQLSNEFYNITINNSSGGISLSDELAYSNTLTLTNGIVTTGTNDTFFVESTTAANMPSGSSSCFINGIIRFNIASNTSIYTIPLGTGTTSSDYYRVDFVNNNLTGTNSIIAQMKTGAPPNYDATLLNACLDSSTQSGVTAFRLKEFPSDGYLVLTPNAQPSGGSYGLNVYIANYTTTTWTDNKIAIFKRSEGSTDNCAWDVAGTLPADGATGRKKTDDYISFTGATSFSEMGPGGEGGGGLPVTLSSFSAELNDEGAVDLYWTTMSEQDNEKFIVQRSKDSADYSDIDEVPGAGNSIVRIDYHTVDEDPLFGTSYYRLEQHDYSGDVNYSDIVSVDNNHPSTLDFKVYRNASDKLAVEYTLSDDQVNDIVIHDLLGRIVYMETISSTYGENKVEINTDNFKNGIYMISFESEGQTVSVKVPLM